MNRSNPFKSDEFFKYICNMIKFNDDDINISSAESEAIDLVSPHFNISMELSVDDAVYCDFIICGFFGGDETQNVHIGTIMSLNTTDDSIKNTSILGTEFLIKANNYIKTNIDDFNFTGYSLYVSQKDKESAVEIGWSKEIDDLEQENKDVIDKNKIAFIRNNATRHLISIKE